MKTIHKLILLIALFGITSCGDEFLEQPPRGSLTVGSFPASEADAELAVNACYNILRTWQINTGGFPILDMMADDGLKGSNPGDGVAISVYDKFEHNAIEGTAERWYKTVYEAIRRTNLVINEVPNIEMDVALQQRYIAEARFLRAYFYSIILRGYGDLPLVTTIDPPLDLERSPIQQILDEVVYPDLENAIAILPKRSEYPPEDLGRATSGAAEAMLARVKLYYGDFADVEALTRSVIESAEYSLVPSFDDVFTEANEQNEESIFEIGALRQNFANGGNQYGNTQGVRGSPNKGWGFCRPSYLDLIVEYVENEDPRLDATVLFQGETIDGIFIAGDGSNPDTIRENGQIIEVECYNQKVWVPGITSLESFGHNRRIIRYADVLLMHAEALNENGKSAEALPFLNQVRARARGNNANVLPDVTTTDMTQLREAIWAERKYELALEGLRFWDLVRTGRAAEVLGPKGFQANKNELLPLPQSEIDISQGRIIQNPGY